LNKTYHILPEQGSRMGSIFKNHIVLAIVFIVLTIAGFLINLNIVLLTIKSII